MIEMMAELIAGILGLIKKGKFQKASKAIENVYHDILRQDASFFNNIPLHNLSDSLISEHNYTNGHLEILSELFYAQAELSHAQKRNIESLEYYQKSLHLLEFVIKESKTFSVDKQTRLSEIKKKIKVFSQN